MQSLRTGCGKHNKLINAFIEIILDYPRSKVVKNDQKEWQTATRSAGFGCEPRNMRSSYSSY